MEKNQIVDKVSYLKLSSGKFIMEIGFRHGYLSLATSGSGVIFSNLFISARITQLNMMLCSLTLLTQLLYQLIFV